MLLLVRGPVQMQRVVDEDWKTDSKGNLLLPALRFTFPSESAWVVRKPTASFSSSTCVEYQERMC